MKERRESEAPETLAAFCGLYCGACSVYIASTEDPVRLARLSARLGTSPEELRCLGCRSEVLGVHCRNCAFKACAKGRGLESCSTCEALPCEELKAFQRERPHRLELWEDLAALRESGAAEWLRAVRDRYVCPDCGMVNSAYDLSCRHCGTSPSCDFVKRHRKAIENYFSKMR